MPVSHAPPEFEEMELSDLPLPSDETPLQGSGGEVSPRVAAGVPADLAAQHAKRGRLSYWKHEFARRAGVPLNRLFGGRLQNAFGILMYHRVTHLVPGVAEPTFNVTPERFREQLTGLLARGFIAWPLRLVLESSQRGRQIPREVFVVTFDDGYENVYQHAWPVLRDLGIPATIFVSTSYLDSQQPFPFDNWSAKGSPAVSAESWRPLTTAQCRQMHASGLIELATHTHTHADFRNRPDELAIDLETSLEVLRERFGISNSTFAFPYGTRKDGFSGPVLSEACRKVGLLCSLTTEQELTFSGTDPFDWGRFEAESNDTSETLAAKLNGWYSLLRGAWRRMRHPFQAAPKPAPRRVVTATTLSRRFV